MNSKLYDRVKYINQIALPALITFYGVVGLTLALPFLEQTLTISVAFNVMLGALLAKSSAEYYKEQAK